MSFDIFISYSSKDRERVRTIAERLEREFLVWWDPDLISGTKYPDVIDNRLRTAGTVLVAWSAQAEKSAWVEKETRAALQSSRLIPIRLDSTPLAAHMSDLDAIDLRDWDGKSGHIQIDQLVRDIKLHRAPTQRPGSATVAAGLNLPRSKQNGDDKLSSSSIAGFAAAVFAFVGLDQLVLAMVGVLAAVAAFWWLGEKLSKLGSPARYISGMVQNFAAGLCAGAILCTVVFGASWIGSAFKTPLTQADVGRGTDQRPPEVKTLRPPDPPPFDAAADRRDAIKALGSALTPIPNRASTCADLKTIMEADSDSLAFRANALAEEREQDGLRHKESSPGGRSIERDLVGSLRDIELLYAHGCTKSDWAAVVSSAASTTATATIPLPPFILE